ncbi:hypothetical protein EDC04DRAFT_2897160 [Pisolithus marmoratus]|nr:hypothetical protein EDC04DRAFT_2897160 [Pisolithus marmoratus]
MEAFQIYGVDLPSPSSEKSDCREMYEKLWTVKVSLWMPEHDMDTLQEVQAERTSSSAEGLTQEMDMINWMPHDMWPSLWQSPDSDLFEQMKVLAEPQPISPSVDQEDDSELEILMRMWVMRIPSPPDESDVEVSEEVETEPPTLIAEVLDSVPFEEMGNAADYGQEIDFGDPERENICEFLADGSKAVDI